MGAHKLLNKNELMDNEIRDRIMAYLSSKPGSYLGKVSRDLDIPTSTLKYHLNILRSFDLVTTVKKGRCRHYFTRERRLSDLEKRMYAAIEHGPTRRIVEIMRANPGISQSGLVHATDLSQSTVAWHMAKLEELELIRSHRNDVKEYYLRGDFEVILNEMREREAMLAPAITPPSTERAAPAKATIPEPTRGPSPFAGLVPKPPAPTPESPFAVAPTRDVDREDDVSKAPKFGRREPPE